MGTYEELFKSLVEDMKQVARFWEQIPACRGMVTATKHFVETYEIEENKMLRQMAKDYEDDTEK